MAHKHPVYDTDKHFVIDPTTKKISTESPKIELAQHSHNSERFTFEIPKMVEGHDMSSCNLVEVHFQNVDAANKSNKNIDIYRVTDLTIATNGTEDIVIGSWLIDKKATQYVGKLDFAMRFACTAEDGTLEYSWPTLACSLISIAGSICNSDTIAEEHPEILAQFEARIQTLEKGGAGIGTVELLAENWEGEGNLYSQIVTVNGADVTENSQVDLTPDVEQLVVFHEKDLTFVTENDDGVVTVYAIGQKPANDYTIQVTITEVVV